MSEPLAFLNGQFIPAALLSVSIADAGFVFGATATEFVRTFGGRLFRLGDHLERLRHSCELCRIPLAANAAELTHAAETLVANNRALSDSELALIIFATPGPIAHYGAIASVPTLAMHTMPLALERYRHLFGEGARLVIPAIRNSPAIDPRAKMRSRMHWWIAEQQAHDIDPHAWALLLDTEGFVMETAAANVLIVRDNVVLSPPRSTILNGVSLRVTQELCMQLSIGFREQPLTVAQCLGADEAMLTGTAFCLAGVRAFGNREMNWPGPITRQLQRAWDEQVGFVIEREFLGAQRAQ
jgi:branched-subunit amino acid aminotransferase/4-amino-4-deoxychorismate lyase